MQRPLAPSTKQIPMRSCQAEKPPGPANVPHREADAASAEEEEQLPGLLQTDETSAHASANAVNSNLRGSIKDGRSEPEVTKSSCMRITLRDGSESLQEAREGEQDWTQMRRDTGISRSKSALEETAFFPARNRREPGGRAATPTDRVSTRFTSTPSQRRCQRSGETAVSVKACWSEYKGAGDGRKHRKREESQSSFPKTF